MLTKLEKPVLVLNKNYHPIGTSPLKEVLNLITTTDDASGKFKAVVIDEDCVPHTWEQWREIEVREGEEAVYTVRYTIKIPQVVRLNKYDKVRSKYAKLTRHNIFKRDEYRCQYCGVKPGSEELSIDHIVPRARGGTTTWTNCVLSCVDCNSAKGSSLCNEVRTSKFPKGMKLLKDPIKPKQKDLKITLYYESWKSWLDEAYWNVELEDGENGR